MALTTTSRLLSVGVALVLLLGCDNPSESHSVGYCYPNSDEDKAFANGLKSEGISFSREDGCILIDRVHKERAAQVRTAVFGSFPPPGRSISLGPGPERNRELIEQLAREGIETSVVTYHGDEFVTWSEEDADRVDLLLDLPANELEVFQRQRGKKMPSD